MLYFSQLKGKKIFTENNKYIGELQDVLFLSTETPLVTKMSVKTMHNKQVFIPMESVTKVNGTLIIPKEFEQQERKDDELSVMKNVMDRQIIDVKGSKVVRVNDVAIQDKLGKSWYVAGVDIGLRGILRWLHLEDTTLPVYRMLGLQSHPHFLSWSDFEPLELEKGNVQLKKNLENLERMRPEDLADYLEKTNIRNVSNVVTNLKQEYAADVIEDLNANFQTALFRRFSPERAAKLIELIDPEDAVDILLTLSKERRKEILDSVSEKKQKKLAVLLKLSDTPIGELIMSDYLTIGPNITVKDALSVTKDKFKEVKPMDYIYVISDENKLIGVISIRDLFTQPEDAIVTNFMEQDLVVVHLTTPLDIAIKRMLKYRKYMLPVVQGDRRMVGVITFDDVADDVLEKI